MITLIEKAPDGYPDLPPNEPGKRWAAVSDPMNYGALSRLRTAIRGATKWENTDPTSLRIWSMRIDSTPVTIMQVDDPAFSVLQKMVAASAATQERLRVGSITSRNQYLEGQELQRRLKSRFDTLEVETKQLRAQVSQLQAEDEGQKIEYANCRRKVRLLESQLEFTRSCYGELNAKCDMIKDEKVKLLERVENLMASNADLRLSRDNLLQHTQPNAQLQEERETLSKEVARLEVVNADLHQGTLKLMRRAQQAECHLTNTQGALSDLKIANQQHKDMADEYRKAEEQYRQTAQSQVEELQRLRGDLSAARLNLQLKSKSLTDSYRDNGRLTSVLQHTKDCLDNGRPIRLQVENNRWTVHPLLEANEAPPVKKPTFRELIDELQAEGRLIRPQVKAPPVILSAPEPKCQRMQETGKELAEFMAATKKRIEERGWNYVPGRASLGAHVPYHPLFLDPVGGLANPFKLSSEAREAYASAAESLKKLVEDIKASRDRKQLCADGKMMSGQLVAEHGCLTFDPAVAEKPKFRYVAVLGGKSGEGSSMTEAVKAALRQGRLEKLDKEGYQVVESDYADAEFRALHITSDPANVPLSQEALEDLLSDMEDDQQDELEDRVSVLEDQVADINQRLDTER